MKLTLRIWRQDNADAEGRFEVIQANHLTPEMSFLEMLDVVNVELVKEGKRPIEFDSDCREGICGTCGVVINGQPHGPVREIATCQLHLRSFKDGDTLIIEPWRAKAFPVVRDLVVNRSALDRIIQAGGYISAKAGKHADANAILVSKDLADRVMDYAQCIGCGACVAACPNASASLFTGAKIAHLSSLPQGLIERARRASRMVAQMDKEEFGNCSNIGECSAVCPKNIQLEVIAKMKRDYVCSILSE